MPYFPTVNDIEAGSEGALGGKDERSMLLKLMRRMLQWRPDDRERAKPVPENPWLNIQIVVVVYEW